jgi:hypothetical protein
MQTDNQSNPSQSPLPRLNLSNDQKQVIVAHISDAIQQLVGIRFTKDTKEDSMMANAYQHGRLDLAKSLLAFDSDQAGQAQEQVKHQGNMLLSPGEQEGIPGLHQAEPSNQTF